MRSKQEYVPSYYLAIVYAGLGEKDQALAWRQKAYEDRQSELIGLRIEPGFDPLRSDPRFQDLIRRVGLPP